MALQGLPINPGPSSGAWSVANGVSALIDADRFNYFSSEHPVNDAEA